MDEQLKRRLVGAAVIVSLVVIFVPMLLDEPVDTDQTELPDQIPDKPKVLQRPLPSQEILPEPIPPETVAPAQTPVDTGPKESPPVSSEPPEPVPTSTLTEQADSSPEGKRASPTAWLVQVGSFTQRDNATKLVERLKQASLPAQLHEVTIDGKRHFRVQMLPQLDRRDAETLIKRIKKEFELTATLLRYPE